jgi:hypothetical protein
MFWAVCRFDQAVDDWCWVWRAGLFPLGATFELDKASSVSRLRRRHQDLSGLSTPRYLHPVLDSLLDSKLMEMP